MSDTARAEAGVRASWCAVNWTRSPSDHGDPTPSSIAELFGPGAEQWRAARAINPQRAARILAGRLVVRDLVAERGIARWAGFEPTAPGRKPTIAGSETDFSIAHSGQWLLAAIVSAGRVGVDVEIHTMEFDHPGLMKRMCTPAELELARQLEPEQRRAWLARLWTAKEAVSKLDGCGLRKDFRHLQVGERIPTDEVKHPIAASIAVSGPRNPSGFSLLRPQIAQTGIATGMTRG